MNGIAPRIQPILALGLLLLAGLAACGGGTAQPPAPSARPTAPPAPTAAPIIPSQPPQPPPPPPAGTMIVDNDGPGFTIVAGDWGTCDDGDCSGTCYGQDFRFAEPGCSDCQARYDFAIPASDDYVIWAWWPWGEDRATDTPFAIRYSDGPYTAEIDQRNSGDDWFYVAELYFEAGEVVSVIVEGSASGYANADAVALTPAGSGPPGAAGPPEAGAPVIQYFYYEEAGAGCYYLHWEVSEASAVYLDDEEVDNPGSTEVCPEETTTYTLWAENEEDSVQQDLAIGVGAAEPPTPAPATALPPPPATGAIIIDHTCTDITKIPDHWLEQAKQLTLHYAHTSHGSQLVTGAEWLEWQNATYNVAVRYCGDDAGLPAEGNALRICDGNPPGGDYVTPEDYWSTTDGLNRTRGVADTGLFNFSMWSWCGQQSENDTGTVQQYLDTLDQLEREYPNMRFIYMTGHTDGGSDVLERNNDLVRQYALGHGKILFDFADFERYDPAGDDYPYADDSCVWCDDWCNNHPEDCRNLEQIDDCAHTHPLQCKLKGQAFWWLMARLAGWDGVP